MMTEFRMPHLTQRLAVIGRTGSGKTQQGAWFLSRAPFDKQPYIIIDYKRDELLQAMDRVVPLTFQDRLPRTPGLYTISPLPDQLEEMEQWLWKVWAKERIGLYFDESYFIPDPMKGGAWRAILTQGRSKHIPVIALTQRPAWVSRFLFSEADYFSVFHLNTKEDVQRVASFIPGKLDQRLPDYHSRWYDVGKDSSFVMQPVPEADEILNVIDERLTPKRKLL